MRFNVSVSRSYTFFTVAISHCSSGEWTFYRIGPTETMTSVISGRSGQIVGNKIIREVLSNTTICDRIFLLLDRGLPITMIALVIKSFNKLQ